MKRDKRDNLAQVNALIKGGRPGAAKKHLQSILADDPDNLDALGLWLELHLRSGSTEAKLNALNRLLVSAQRQQRLRYVWDLLSWLGESNRDPILQIPRWEIAFENGKTGQAWDLLRKTLVANPRLVPFFRSRFSESRIDQFLLGKLFLLGGAAQDARILRQAFRMAGRHEKLPVYTDGVLQKALPTLKLEAPYPLLDAGRLLLRLGRLPEAARLLEAHVRIESADADAVREIIEALPPRAREIPEIVGLHARILCASGHFATAREILLPGERDKAFLYDLAGCLSQYEDAMGLYLRGTLCHLRSEPDAAVAHLTESARTFGPQRIHALALLGDLYLETPFDRRIPDLLLELAESALDVVLEDEVIRISVVLAAREDELLQSPDRISPPAERLLEVLPDNPVFIRIVVRAAIASGETKLAEERLLDFLRAHPRHAPALVPALDHLVTTAPLRWPGHAERVRARLAENRKGDALRALVEGIHAAAEHGEAKVALSLDVLIEKPKRGQVESVAEALTIELGAREILEAGLPSATGCGRRARVLAKILEAHGDEGLPGVKVARGLACLHAQDGGGAARAFGEALHADATLSDLVDSAIRSVGDDTLSPEDRDLMAGDLHLARGDASRAAQAFWRYLVARPEQGTGLEDRVAELLALDEDCARGHMIRGRLASTAKKTSAAVAGYEAAYAADPALAEEVVEGLREIGGKGRRPASAQAALATILIDCVRIDEAVEAGRDLAPRSRSKAELVADLMGRATTSHADHAGAWFVLGWASLRLGRNDAAAAALRRAVEVEPARRTEVEETIRSEGLDPADSPPLTRLWLELLIEMRRLGDALELLAEGLDLSTLDPALAEECLERILEREPGNVAAEHTLARARALGGDPDGAATTLKELVGRHPAERDTAIARLQELNETDGAGVTVGRVLAALEAECGRTGEAAETLRKTMSLDPDSIRSVLEDIRSLTQTCPDASEVQITLVRAHLDNGDPDSATAAVQELYDRDPDENQGASSELLGEIIEAAANRAPPRILLARIHLDQKRWDDSVEECARARETDDEPANLDEIREILEGVLEIVPEHAGGMLQLAETHRLAGDQERAVAEYMRAVERDPTNLKTVLAGVEHCLSDSPKDPSLHLTLGRLQEVHGAGPRKAIELYSRGLRALDDDGDGAALHAARGRSWLALDETGKAHDDLKRAARTLPLTREDCDFLRLDWRRRLEDAVESRTGEAEGPEPTLGTAGLLFRLGRHDVCVSRLQGQVPGDRDLAARMEYLKGLAFQRDELHDLARVAFERCAADLPETDPLAKYARFALAICLESMGGYDEAIQALSGIIQVDAEFPHVRERMRRLSAELQGRAVPPPAVVEMTLRELRPQLSDRTVENEDRTRDAEAR